MTELWRTVNFNNNYEVSNIGNLRRKKADGDYFVLKGSIQKTSGYKYANITNPLTKKRKLCYIHNLVLTAFVGERPEETEESGRYVCDHINRCKTDNTVSNLRWVTELVNLRNTANYNTEIATTDKKERKRALYQWRKKHPDRVKKRRKMGTGNIVKIGDNKYFCCITINGKKYKKTVNGDFEKAEEYCKFMNEFYK
jgi:hypothetical protein